MTNTCNASYIINLFALFILLKCGPNGLYMHVDEVIFYYYIYTSSVAPKFNVGMAVGRRRRNCTNGFCVLPWIKHSSAKWIEHILAKGQKRNNMKYISSYYIDKINTLITQMSETIYYSFTYSKVKFRFVLITRTYFSRDIGHISLLLRYELNI